MAEELYNKKLADLQKHIPFMENMIAQLKDPKWKPREAQLNKMESLYNMITDRNKKWKFETLLKCEEVILKLQSKVDLRFQKANKPIFPAQKKEQFVSQERPGDKVSNTVSDIMNALKFNNARAKLNCEMSTPKSPSPVPDVVLQQAPKIIPFEATNEPIRKSTNIIDPNELSVTWNNDKQDRYMNEKPDIYASAAKSLGVVPIPNSTTKVSIFDRLGPVVPEVPAKPLLSEAELEMLQDGDDFVVICQNDRQIEASPTDKQPQKKTETKPAPSPELNLKVAVRLAPVPASKPKVVVQSDSDKDAKVKKKHVEIQKEEKNKQRDSPVCEKAKNKSDKIVTSDIFGNCLSSIDNMIIGDTKKKDKKKEERRHSGEYKKEKYDSKHHHKHKSEEKPSKKPADPRLKTPDVVREELKPEVKVEIPLTSPISMEGFGDKPKRLADKYNPKPRRHADGELDPGRAIEAVSNYESRDPRRRPSAASGLLNAQQSQLGSPPYPTQQATPLPINFNALPLGNLNALNVAALPVIPQALASFLSPTQATMSPTQAHPLMQLNLQGGQGYQSPTTWNNESHQEYSRPHFEPPQKHYDPPQKHYDPRRQAYHQDGDPRRPKFSPPPSMSPQFAQNYGYGAQAHRNDYCPTPAQRGVFEPPPSPGRQSNSRYDSPRFEPPAPMPNNQPSAISRKSFNPFEPLDAGRESEGHFKGDPYRRSDNSGFRSGYGQYNNNRYERISDRYARKPARDNMKPMVREDVKFKPRETVKTEEDTKWKTEPEVTHTKYDQIYSKLDVERETFTSPLESLYSNSKADVKASIQSFKIPKKPKPEPSPPVVVSPPPVAEEVKEEKPPVKVELKVEESPEPEVKEKTVVVKSSSEDSEDQSDDMPLRRRISSRTRALNQKKVIEDTEEESSAEEEVSEETQESSSGRPKRSARQSAIKANKLITKKPAVRSKKKQKPKRKEQKPVVVEDTKEEIVEKELPKTEAEEKEDVHVEQVDETEVKMDEKIEATPKEEEVVKEEVEVPKEELQEVKAPDAVQKAKEELLHEAKKKNLNLNDQGAEVLQFILMNYKKIKKIFKSDSSSDEEDREKKKKKKKKDKSSSSSTSSSDDDEKESVKEKKKTEKKTEKKNEEEQRAITPPVVAEAKALEPEPEKEIPKEIPSAEKEESAPVPAEEEVVNPPLKEPVLHKKIKKIPGRKPKMIHKKFPVRITRNQALRKKPITKKARRSELDKLHDDIKEMLMGNEVLTSTGKRACTMPKDDSENTTEDQQSSSSTLEQSSPAISTNLRVVIEKTDIEKLLTKETAAKAASEDERRDPGNEEVVKSPAKLEAMAMAVVKSKGNKKIFRKKKHRWASGIIKRKNRRKLSTSEDTVEDAPKTVETSERVLHDKEYFVDGPKSPCRLCSFKGKMIVHHYRSAHPESEVLIARMDPSTTEHLIRESRINDYESIVVEDVPTIKKKRFGFKCPFNCLFGTTVDTFENYYDHVTVHTGEHRYFCPFCSFTTTNPRNLRAHMVTQHNSNLDHHGKPKIPTPPASKYIFGYVCSECHYVQTRREKLEDHVAKYHPTSDTQIVKINLSLVCKVHEDAITKHYPAGMQEKRTQKKQVHINECIESVVQGAGKVKTPEPALVKNLSIFDLMSQMEAEHAPPLPVEVKAEPMDSYPDLDALIPEVQLEEAAEQIKSKDPDLTVFMCQSALPADDEQSIEERRLKKMNEIQENCRPTRTSIVDKLQSRLETEAQEGPPILFPEQGVPSPVVVPCTKPPALVPLDRLKKSLDSIPMNFASTEMVVAPKKLAPISNIINRLQDKLLPTPGTSRQVTPTPPESAAGKEAPFYPALGESDSGDLQVGPVSLTLNKNLDVVYSCYNSFCLYTTLIAKDFEKHCREKHADYVYSESKCHLCQIKIDKEDNYVTMLDIYRHVCVCHMDFFDAAAARKKNKVTVDEPTSAVSDEDVNITLEDIQDVISQASEDFGGTKYPFKIADVTTIAEDVSIPPVDFPSDTGKKYPFVITNVASTVDFDQISQQPAEKQPEVAAVSSEVPNLISQVDVPQFPFKITNVTSMSEKAVTNVATASASEGNQSTTNDKRKNETFILPHQVPNLISQADGGPGPRFPFVITSVTSLAKKPPTAYVVPPPSTIPLAITSTASFQIPVRTSIQSSSNIQPFTITTMAPNTTMVPLILNSVVAEREQPKTKRTVISRVPPGAATKVRPTSASSTTGNRVTIVGNDGSAITFKDIPLGMQERLVARKSSIAKQLLLAQRKAARFYRCPEYSCSCSFDKSHELNAHLSSHSELIGKYVSCLYCDYKTPFKTYVLHLEVQHANCQYACGRCFYRATNSAFVEVHNRSEHHKQAAIVVKTPKENMPARIDPQTLVPIKSILKNYVCGQFGCAFKTIFGDVFQDHLKKEHSHLKVILCGICGLERGHLESHWASHGVHPYHCRYCSVGNHSIEVVVNHQALIHAKMDCCIIARKFVPDPKCPERTADTYSIDFDETYERLQLIHAGGSTTDPAPIPEEITIVHTPPPTTNVLSTVTEAPSAAVTEAPAFLEVDLTSPTDSREGVAGIAEPEIPILSTNLDEADKDPLSLDVGDTNAVVGGADNASDGFSDSNDDKDLEIDAGATYDPLMVAHTEEYTGLMLYKCVCGKSVEDKVQFKSHLLACQKDKTYKCAHCGVVRKTPRALITHMNEHGRKRFKCSLCQYKHFSKRFVKDHLNVDHNVHEMMLLPATVSKKVDYNNDDFVLRPKLSPVKRIGSAGANSTSTSQPGSNKTVFSTAEIVLLPRQPIYPTEVFCAVCNYATKVKSNMVRHLQAHQNEQAVPETAPVNPVPCLEKSEKMFDKMVNLAISSHAGGKVTPAAKVEKAEEINVPGFVPINKRYVCGADTCNYLCPEEGMLRRHLTTLHSQELNYTCLHCKSKIFDDKSISVDVILQHLKLHDNPLYGCGFCKFIHNLKHKVERHLADKHADKSPSLVVFRDAGKDAETEGETATPPVVEKEKGQSKKKLWRCGMCKFKSATLEEAKSHAQSKHNVDSKNKCALCEFGSEDVTSFGKHYELNHSGQPIEVIVSYYTADELKRRKADVDPEFNTTPLWQRNKNVKHIRGILLEETNSKVVKTPNTKKAKTLKWKKIEMAREEAMLAEANKKDKSVQPPDPATKPEGNKRGPKRRKSRVDSKSSAAPLPVVEEKKSTDKGKKADTEVIFITFSDEDNADVINLDEVPEKVEEPLKEVPELKFDVSNLQCNDIVDLDSIVANLTMDIDQITSAGLENANKVTVLKPNIEKLDVIEITDEKIEDEETRAKKVEDVNPSKEKQAVLLNCSEIIELSNSEDSLKDSAEKIDKSITEVLESCKLNFDDSSCDELDMLHIAEDEPLKLVDGATVEEVLKLEEARVQDPPKDSLLKIKVVDLCTLKEGADTASVAEEQEKGIAVEDDAGPSSSKKLKLDISLKEIANMDKRELMEGNFVGTYGPYGAPWCGNFKCPLCEKYITMSSKDFMAHVHKELQYGIYKCGVCDYRDASRNTVLKHHRASHKRTEPETGHWVVAEPDQQIEEWVEKLIIFQMRLLAVEKDKGQAEVHLNCSFCDYRCVNASDMRKHKMRHWTVPPYSCDACSYKGIYRIMVERHIKRCHPHANVLELDVQDEVVIKRTRQGKSEPAIRAGLYPTNEMDSKHIDLTAEGLDRVHLNCCHCDFREIGEQQKKHCKEAHPDKKLSVYRYKCNYCASTFVSSRTMNEHFGEFHACRKYSFTEVSELCRDYSCPKCSASDDNLATIRDHLWIHFKMFKCLYCEFTGVYWKTMWQHWHDQHQDETFEFLFILSEEKRYKEAVGEIKAFGQPQNNKKRKQMDGDCIILDDVNPEERPPQPVKMREVARKSTGGACSSVRREPEPIDLTKIITTIDVMGGSVTMNIQKLARILNIYPVVLLEDCRANDL